MISKLDASNQIYEIVFSRKTNASNHETVYFNNVLVIRQNIQKHLGFFLASKLSFLDHINKKTKKDAKELNVIRKIILFFTTFFSGDNI